MRQALAKNRKQAVESLKSFGALRLFDNETFLNVDALTHHMK